MTLLKYNRDKAICIEFLEESKLVKVQSLSFTGDSYLGDGLVFYEKYEGENAKPSAAKKAYYKLENVLVKQGQQRSFANKFTN